MSPRGGDNTGPFDNFIGTTRKGYLIISPPCYDCTSQIAECNHTFTPRHQSEHSNKMIDNLTEKYDSTFLDRSLRDKLRAPGKHEKDIGIAAELEYFRRINFRGTPTILLGPFSIMASSFVEFALNNFKIVALVDNAHSGTIRNGIPVVGSNLLPELLLAHPDAAGVMCCQSDQAVDHFLSKWDNRPVFSLFQASKRTPEHFFDEFTAPSLISRIHQCCLPLISDEMGRRTLLSVLLYRLTWEYHWLAHVRHPYHSMYFHAAPFKLRNDETFIDAGGFDGDTALSFARAVGGQYRQIHIFEADPANLASLQKNTAPLERAHVHAAALWHEQGTLNFRCDGLGSQLSTDGETTVSALALDDLDLDNVSLIKMDIEGAEVNALRGARKTISKFRPKLAISAYHLPDDFITIIEEIRSSRNDYRFTIRHHSPFIRDSVIYAY